MNEDCGNQLSYLLNLSDHASTTMLRVC